MSIPLFSSTFFHQNFVDMNAMFKFHLITLPCTGLQYVNLAIFPTIRSFLSFFSHSLSIFITYPLRACSKTNFSIILSFYFIFFHPEHKDRVSELEVIFLSPFD